VGWGGGVAVAGAEGRTEKDFMIRPISRFSEKIEMIYHQYPEYTVSNNSTMSSLAQLQQFASKVSTTISSFATLEERSCDVCGCDRATINAPTEGTALSTEYYGFQPTRVCRGCAYYTCLLNSDSQFHQQSCFFKGLMPLFLDGQSITHPTEHYTNIAIGISHDTSLYPKKLHPFYANQIVAAFRASHDFALKHHFTTLESFPPNILDLVSFAGACFAIRLSTKTKGENNCLVNHAPTLWMNPAGEIGNPILLGHNPEKYTDKNLIIVDFTLKIQVDTRSSNSDKTGIDRIKPIFNCDECHKTIASPDRTHHTAIVHYPKHGNTSTPVFMCVKDYLATMKQTKEQTRREEQRIAGIKQREEEIALRAARATLVTAVAKIDADLERIKHLKELNKEVALKNQKIADRKEAEKLAIAAEKRHAEKLKQKEIERQKFLSKKN
jgi:hypothetical protein